MNEQETALRDELADMIADWYGRAAIDADRDLAQQIINRVSKELLVESTATLSYRGVDRRGVGRCGVLSEPAADFIAERFRQGWRSLVVQDASGEEFGAIYAHLDTGRRTWWAVAPVPAVPAPELLP